MTNKLYFGDNLSVMRRDMKDESVDLIYLDPPFNSKANYNVLFKDADGKGAPAQILAFEDTWHWSSKDEEAYEEIQLSEHVKLAKLLEGLLGALGRNDMMSYLMMMSVRLIELHRVLKPSGSIYLHCDPTASHYIKAVMDAVFGGKNFRNEIAWCYSNQGRGKREFPHKHDTILFYSKSGEYAFYPEACKIPYSEAYIKTMFTHVDDAGRQCRKRFDKGAWRIYYPDAGMLPNDWWTDIHPLAGSSERMGYPTQKPEALLERIILASSNEGDVVFDPFCGCATTLVAAERLNRKWIGIDITYLSIMLVKQRLRDTFPDPTPYDIEGIPTTLDDARALALESRYQFQWWSLDTIYGRPAGGTKKKGADSGIDGYITCRIPDSETIARFVVSVKSGGVKPADIRDLRGVIERDKLSGGVFVTLEPPSKPMKQEAIAAGFGTIGYTKFPRLEIVTTGEILKGQLPKAAQFAGMTG